MDVLQASVDQMVTQGWSVEALALDVTDLEAMTKALKAQAAFDIVLNAAGLARHSPALETTPQDYDAVMDVNVKAAYFLSVGAAHGMIAAGKPGSIIHISSQMGHVGGIDRAVYCASKHAVQGMVKAMAVEWGKAGIRINTICPTFIRTPLTEPTFSDPERLAWIMDKIKLPRVGEVADVMGATLFLASDASAMVTGTSMMIDGGWTAD
jgi:2-deoxy-D-gluconate 3-dehydrogenase